jgi:hypothetical protein
MVRLGTKRRGVLAETLRELANLIVGAFVVGQYVAPQPPSIALLVSGLAAWLALVIMSLIVTPEDTNV